VRDELLEQYFSESISWDTDRIAQTARSERRAWQIALAGWICALACALALLALMPLKRVEPFVVRVDNSTGIVDVVPVYAGEAGLQQTVTRYFLSHYVSTCERFSFATAESDYEECGAFHGAQRNQAWYTLWNPNNPSSPLNVHKDGGTVRVQVQSVSFFQRANGVADLAQVRYVTAERSGAGGEEHSRHWIATIQYAYTQPSGDPKVRRWNPLGFKVLDLTTEPEVTAPSQDKAGQAG
jgi:type IV secretion system protein VirB8